MRFREQVKLRRGELVLSGLWILRALCRSRLPGLHKMYVSLLIRLVKGTGLFDRAHYLETNIDIAEAGLSPLRHYVTYGDREGRWPMPLFDPNYYRSRTKGKIKHLNALLHYAYVGRYRRISSSSWFDLDYYLSHNKDVARAGVDPLLHYLNWGGREGRSPSPYFDSSYYLNANPDVESAGTNPLLHYLLYGRFQGRYPLADHNEAYSDEVVQPTLPKDFSWSKLDPRSDETEAVVDVVIPVYKGTIVTLRCIHSVLRSASKTPFHLVVINDASPESELVSELEELADEGAFTLLSNNENCGFVKTVNRGMMLHQERDVVLLNSDTEVYDGWLDRLRAAAERNERSGTITPLSNNATICSYPLFLHDNPFPLELSYAELDAIAAEVNAAEEAEAPTGVGFCMYIKRECLSDVGPFDEKAFGKGYGEENDFCQRAIKRGWRNIIAADIFVRHWGAASFRGEKAKRVELAMKILEKRHPRYHREVQEYIAQDLLAPARQRLDWARLQRMRRKKNVLIVCHNRGGGTERHVQEDIQRLTQTGVGVFLMRPACGKPTHAVLSHPAVRSLPNTKPLALAETAALTNVLEELGIDEVHTHSLVDFVPKAPEYLVAIIQALGARWELNIHDYKVICPRINLADDHGFYCGEPEGDKCNVCLSSLGSDFAVKDIRQWREMHAQVLVAADEVLVPDEDVQQRLQRYFPAVSFSVSPHEVNDSLNIPQQLLQRHLGEDLRIVIIGAIGKLKGYDILLNCARDARQRRLGIQFIVMGYSMNDRMLEDAGVQITGKYAESEAVELLSSLEPHLVLLPSLWPETYSYTLSVALQAGYPVAAFDIGAIASRLRKLNREELLIPLSHVRQTQYLNDMFLEYGKVLDASEFNAAS